jgi:hypothetical protein
MGRLFEQGSDVDPILTHRVAMGLAGNTTKNSTWTKIIAWLNTKLQIPASQVTEETDLNFMTDAEETKVTNIITEQTIVNIGVWDMDADTTKVVAHGLADITKIRDINVMILNDADTVNIPLMNLGSGASDICGISNVDGTNITLFRFTSGFFDNTDYDDGVKNRGFILIETIL